MVAVRCLAGQMEEEVKLEFTITVNWRREDGSIAMTQLGTLDRGACRSAQDVGLQLAHAKSILGRQRGCGQGKAAAVLPSCAPRVPAGEMDLSCTSAS